jgi:hypothetical protein
VGYEGPGRRRLIGWTPSLSIIVKFLLGGDEFVCFEATIFKGCLEPITAQIPPLPSSFIYLLVLEKYYREDLLLVVKDKD